MTRYAAFTLNFCLFRCNAWLTAAADTPVLKMFIVQYKLPALKLMRDLRGINRRVHCAHRKFMILRRSVSKSIGLRMPHDMSY